MSLLLFCHRYGNPNKQHAFPIRISKDRTVGDLKIAIMERLPECDVNTMLRKVNIPFDNNDFELTEGEGEYLSVCNQLDEYFPESPANKCIHIIIEGNGKHYERPYVSSICFGTL
jgi:hypothetical protein